MEDDKQGDPHYAHTVLLLVFLNMCCGRESWKVSGSGSCP